MDRRVAEQEVPSRCAACEKPAPPRDLIPCQSCQRRICRDCVRWYGHFMLVCEECRLAQW
ncbi:MAG TPA: hypothetical protein VFK85_02420 [Anaeromyxobacteraceae bacterium]|nr:hypothetical protein [Anaeromyxobacteraceae bacterium]